VRDYQELTKTDIIFAVWTGVVGRAVTLVAIHSIYANTVMLARIRHTLIYVLRTSTSHSTPSFKCRQFYKRCWSYV